MFSQNFMPVNCWHWSKGRILPLLQMDRVNQAEFAEKKLNFPIRNELTTLSVNDDFSKLVLDTLKINMPFNFIECYQQAAKYSDNCYPYHPGIIVSNGWMNDDLIKFWGASCAEKGTTLLDVQHGGGYGAVKFSSYEYLGRKNCDAFISWGWKEKNDVIRAPSTLVNEKFKERNWQNRIIDQNLILWTMTEADRYLSYFESCLESMTTEYLDWQIRFTKKIDQTILPDITLRLRPFSKYYQYLSDTLAPLTIHLPNDRASFFASVGHS